MIGERKSSKDEIDKEMSKIKYEISGSLELKLKVNL
jgi:hypothetical protein